MKKQFLFIISFLLPFSAVAQTNITDDITQNTAWNIAGSPYTILNSISVQDGSSLTIGPGVEVIFSSGVSLSVFGHITSVGTVADSILFTSDQPNPKSLDWDRILIKGAGSNNSEFKYCKIQFGRVGISFENTTARITNSVIEKCHDAGISVLDGSPIIENNVIRGILHSGSGASTGIQISSGSPSFMGNQIYNNDNGITTDFANSHIERNIIYNNRIYGIDNRNANNVGAIAHIINNTIVGNGIPGSGPHGANVNCDNSSPIIMNNIIINSSSGSGIGIRTTSGGAPTVSYNNVWNNTGGNGITGQGDISADPQFVDLINNDFHLTSNSPCIDTGDPTSPVDPDGSRADIGALPFNKFPGLVKLSIDTSFVDPGKSVNIQVNISGLDEVGLVAVQFDLLFDNTFLTGLDVNVDESTLPGQANWSSEFNVFNNKISIAMAGVTPLSGSGILTKIKLQVANNIVAETSTQVSVDSLILNEELILDPDITGVVMIGIPWGDVSRNGEVQAFDASLILQYLSGLRQFSDFQKLLSDVSGNNEITALDASLVLQFVVNKFNLFPVQTDSTENLIASTILNIPELHGAPGEEVLLAFSLSGSENLLSIEFTINYDPNILIFQEIVNLSDKNDFAIAQNTGEDFIRLWMASTNAFVDEDSFLIAKFKISDEASSNSTITVSDLRYNENDVINTYQQIQFKLTTTGVDENLVSNEIPIDYTLSQNFPNPFNPETTIRFQLPKTSDTILRIFDVLGKEIKTLVDKELQAGSYSMSWNGKDNQGIPVSSGNYIYKIQTGSFSQIRKMTLIR